MTGEQLKRLRTRAGLTQTEAARLIYSKLRTWQAWEGEEARMHPGLAELFRIKLQKM